MSDLISKEKLLESLIYCKELGRRSLEAVKKTINEQPTVEPVRGEWIKTFRYMRENVNTGNIEPVYSCDCPFCAWHTGNQGVRFNFCPECGADMRKKVEE